MNELTRRSFLKKTGIAGIGLPLAANNLTVSLKNNKESELTIDLAPGFDLSPFLYMQFMEPLGKTDSSVEAAWDFKKMQWRQDFIEVSNELAPGMMRFGGLFSAHYKWKEAVGKREARVPIQNIFWSGFETNQVGTAEFLDYCKKIKTEPLMCVNFASEGREYFKTDCFGRNRIGDAKEAAGWVDYCNNPSNKERKLHGNDEMMPIKYWQLGNETSYDKNGHSFDTAVAKTLEFAREMKKADPSLKFIGWGDNADGKENEFWAKTMIERTGEHIDYIAFHHMFDHFRKDPETPLQGMKYREDPAKTWDYLMNAYKPHEDKINLMREQVKGTSKPLALTECHYSFKGRNRCEVMSTWAAGVSNARMMNLHERNGDILKIATLADFCGNVWQVNAVMVPNPGGKSYMMPVAKIMSLYKKHTGEKSLKIVNIPQYLDITASITEKKVFLHVVNTSRENSVKTKLQISGKTILSAKVFEIAGDPEFEVYMREPDPLKPVEKVVPASMEWVFPKASVSAVEIDI